MVRSSFRQLLRELSGPLQTGTHIIREDMPLQSGTRLGPYDVITLIGAGGMGDVRLATELRLERKVALQLLPPDRTTDAARIVRFEQEARAASTLNHPNVCTIHALVRLTSTSTTSPWSTSAADRWARRS